MTHPSDLTKTCRGCGEMKPLQEYPRENRNRDGRAARCKKCESVRTGAWARGPGKAKAKAIMAKYQASERGKQAKKRADAKALPKTRRKYPERNRARQAVALALSSGRLKKLPCFICGASRVDAHHPDYSAPLDVIWLCRQHHMQIHNDDGNRS